MISKPGQEPVSINSYVERLLANQYVTVSDNRLINAGEYEAFDFFLKRQAEADAFSKENYSESEQVIRRGLCIAAKRKQKTEQPLHSLKDNKARVQGLLEHTDDVKILRKGMRKFFEISYSSLVTKQVVITDDGKPLSSVAVDPTAPYTVYVTKKEDGENAQLSYCSSIGKFIIGSKNYTIAVSDSAELASYTGVDALHCLTIAKFLMEKIESLSTDKLQKLKELLENHTLIGEYVGDIKFEHIVHSKKRDLKFFSMVAKDRLHGEVEDLEQTMKTVSEFGFSFVHLEKYTKESRDVFEVIYEHASKSANLSLEDVDEGYVVYIFTSTGEVVFKLKSLAYKKEKIFLNTEDMIRRLAEEDRDVQKQTNSSNGMTSNSVCPPNQNAPNYLNEHQLKVIDSLDLGNLTRSKLLVLLNSQISKMLQKAKLYEPFLKPTAEVIISDFFSKCLTCLHKYFVKPAPTFFNGKPQPRVQKHRKPIVVLLPMSIPGCGKSYYGDYVVTPYCELNNYHFNAVSSDKIRNMFIQEYMENNNTSDVDLGFKRTDKKASQAFKNEFYRALKDAMEDAKPGYSGYVIFRDRNHPNLKLLDSIIKEVKAVLKGYNAAVILMVPRILPYLNQGLSYEDLFKCLYRVKNRQNHETLPYKGFDTFITVMYNCYMSFRSIYKTELDYDGIVDYYVEEEFTEKSKEAVSELIDVFKDYNYYKRDKKPLNDKYYYKIRDRYIEAVQKLEIVPKNFDAKNKQKMKNLSDEVDKAFKQNFKSLELLITETHDFLLKDCVEQVRHSIEQPYLGDFDHMLKKTDGWQDADSLYITAFQRSKDRQENVQRFVDFRAGIRVPAKVYLVAYIVNYEIRLYVLKEHRVYIEAQAPCFALRKREDAQIDEESLSSQIINFTQTTNKDNLLKLELSTDEQPKTCVLYRLKNEKILDALCNVNYG